MKRKEAIEILEFKKHAAVMEGAHSTAEACKVAIDCMRTWDKFRDYAKEHRMFGTGKVIYVMISEDFMEGFVKENGLG